MNRVSSIRVGEQSMGQPHPPQLPGPAVRPGAATTPISSGGMATTTTWLLLACGNGRWALHPGALGQMTEAQAWPDMGQ